MPQKGTISLLVVAEGIQDTDPLERLDQIELIAVVREWELAAQLTQLRKPDWLLVIHPGDLLSGGGSEQLLHLVAEVNTTRIALIDPNENETCWRGVPAAVFRSIDEFCMFLSPRRRVDVSEHKAAYKPGGHVVAVVSIKGGVGKTFLACNLAAHLAEQYPDQVVLIDLDTGTSDVAYKLQLPVQRKLPELTLTLQQKEEQPIYDQELKRFLTRMNQLSLWVLTGPEHPELSQLIDIPAAKQLIHWCRQLFRWIVIDSSPDPGHPLLPTIIKSAEDIVIPVTPDLSTLRQTNFLMDIIQRLASQTKGVSSRRHLVLNRLERENEVTLREAEQFLDCAFAVTIAEMKRLSIRAATEGKPGVLIHPDGRDLQKAMAKLHDAIGNALADNDPSMNHHKWRWTGRLQDLWSRLPI